MSDDIYFEPVTSVDSAEMGERHESLNACRAAALGLPFGATVAMQGMEATFRSMGFNDGIADQTWNWRDTEMRLDLEGLGGDQSRAQLFESLAEGPEAVDAIRFLAKVLVSPLERESAAAAASIVGASGRSIFHGDWRQRWWRGVDMFPTYETFLHYLFGPAVSQVETVVADPDLDITPGTTWAWLGARWEELAREALWARRIFNGDQDVRLRLVAEWRLALAIRSADPIVRQFAMAALTGPWDSGSDIATGQQGPNPTNETLAVSALIHGTWGWKGDWWRPAAHFHDFIRNGVRRNLYSRGAPFSWSGAYSSRQRALAAEDFVRWAGEMSPGGIHTLFGHSYGGEVAVRSWALGTKVQEVVLLSVPANRHVSTAVDQGLRVVDIRLAFDPVLALAREPQRIRRNGSNLEQVILSRWQLSHGATHDADVWLTEDLLNRAKL